MAQRRVKLLKPKTIKPKKLKPIKIKLPTLPKPPSISKIGKTKMKAPLKLKKFKLKTFSY